MSHGELHHVITITERAAREKAVREATADARLEGLQFSDEELRIFQRYVEGDLSLDGLRQAIIDLNERNFQRPLRVSGY